MEYQELRTVLQIPDSDQFMLLHCSMCNMDVCCFIPSANPNNGVCIIVNPELKDAEEHRRGMVYSETYGLWLENGEVKEDDSVYPVSDTTERMFFQKRQETIDALFEEKERRIREFVMMQEDIFEEKRREVKHQYSLIKQQYDKNVRAAPSTKQDCSVPVVVPVSGPVETGSENDTVSEHDGVFFFDEEDDDSNRVFQKQAALRKSQSDMRIFHPNRLDEVFPSTFEEYTLDRLHSSFEGSGMTNSVCRLLY